MFCRPGYLCSVESERKFRFQMLSAALQHRPEDIDKRAADMYSFAVILWEIATNKIPFSGLSPMNIGIKVCTDNICTLSLSPRHYISYNVFCITLNL